MVNPLAAAVAGAKDRIAMMVGRGVLAALSSGGIMQASVKGVGGDEVLEGREFTQDYGLSSRPHPGAEALMLFLAGLRSNGVVVRLFDRRYTIALQYGEVAIHDDLGQAVHLTRGGIVIKGAGLPITITDTPKVRAETALWEVTGDIRDRCDSGGRSMAEMRDTYNDHTHAENDHGGPTAVPGQRM